MKDGEKTVTKAELAASISKLGLSLRFSQTVVDYIVQELIQALSRGEVIHLVGFGAFRYKVRHARQGRNPKTGEQVAVPDKKIIQFKPGNELKERIRKAKEPLQAEPEEGIVDGQ